MKKQTLIAAAAFAATSALAQFVGPGASQVYSSIPEIIRSATDDARVELEGYIIKKVGKEKYLFSDGKNEIRVEIDAQAFPATRIDEKVKVRIRGEVEKDFLLSPEIDVDLITVL